MATIAGLDVGGAHLKVALIEDARPVAVEAYACPLWQGLDRLDAAFAAAAPLLAKAERFSVTMTGELSDIYPDRSSGVRDLVERLTSRLGSGVRFFARGEPLGGFVTADQASRAPAAIGSMNFLATTQVAATLLKAAASQDTSGLLVDFGSTTADIVAIDDGSPACDGATDAERQESGGLVYTGHTRTAVMGVTRRAPFKGRWTTLAREYLANMADVRRILGELEDGIDLHATADGRGRSVEESVARLARMLGRDAADGSLDDWRVTARYIAECQMRSLHDGMLQVASARPVVATGPLVTAGIGADVAAALALRIGMQPIAFGDLVGAAPACRRAATYHAPAVAVAMLV